MRVETSGCQHRVPNCGRSSVNRHDRRDLRVCDARLHGKDDHHSGDCGRGALCLSDGWMSQGFSPCQSYRERQDYVTD